MFKHKKDYKKRGGNPLFVIFRMGLSLIILGVLLLGVYSAYRQFSGVDPIKASPHALLANFVSIDKFMDFGIGLLKFDPNKVISEKAKGKSEEVNGEETSNNEINEQSNNSKPAKSALSFKFALVSDSHNENNFLGKALTQAKAAGVKLVIGLGDYTEVGTTGELNDAKKEFDSVGIRYFVSPGDHDLWDARDKGKDAKTNFIETFGRSYQAFTYGHVRFIVLDNSDNYKGVDSAQMEFLKAELAKVNEDTEINSILVFLHEPLYHPSSDRVMGKVTSDLAKQSKDIINLLSEHGVSGVFAGDIHYFTNYNEPDSNLSMLTVGALASLRNAQLPRFGIVSVFEDGSWEVEDVEVK